jgi:RNA polymerase sigma-70 factor, ECF subfamily
MADPITEESARTLRKFWFDYLDSLGSIRPRLHACCLKLTGSVWDAEDLVQDTLLRGFAIIGRADMNPGRDPGGRARRWFDKPEAYLCRIATNLWIDRVRRARRETPAEFEPGAHMSEPLTRAAGAALFERTAPQERAAVVLKDVFDFSLAEIADLLSTTEGAVKSALHRGRSKLGEEHSPIPYLNPPASSETIDRFIKAFVARDVEGVKALLLDRCTWEVQGVGGERGKNTIWLSATLREGIEGTQHVIDGERVAAFTAASNGKTYLGALFRFEEIDGAVSRIVNYAYCGDTLAYVAAKLGVLPARTGYHQEGESLDRMIANAQLPWNADTPPQ